MLTESFFVRRVKKSLDPDTQEPIIEADESGEVGIVRTIQFVPIPNPETGVPKAATILGVCWEKSNFPAITWEDPADLEHLDDTLGNVLDRLQEDYGEEFLEKALEKLLALYGPEAVARMAQDIMNAEDEEEEGEEEEGKGEQEETNSPATH